jgi:hypothetical protein
VGKRGERGLLPKPPWLDPEKVREAEREALRVVREALQGVRRDELASAVLELYREIPRESWLVRGVARVLLGTVARKGEGDVARLRGSRARRLARLLHRGAGGEQVQVQLLRFELGLAQGPPHLHARRGRDAGAPRWWLACRA